MTDLNASFLKHESGIAKLTAAVYLQLSLDQMNTPPQCTHILEKSPPTLP